MSFPTIGIAIGLGIFVVEMTAANYFLTGMRLRGLAAQLGEMLVLYITLGALADVASQLVGKTLSRSLRTPLIRWLGVSAAIALATPGSWPLIQLAGAMLWALLTRHRWTMPIALITIVLAARPMLPEIVEDASNSKLVFGRSVAVIVMDTVRRDDTSTYGYARRTTPNLDQLASRGVRFDRAYATGCWSVPSHASLLTGLLPSTHDAHHEDWTLGDQVPTLAETLSNVGYDTFGVTGNPFVTPRTGLARGFQYFVETWPSWVFRESTIAGRISRVLDSEADKGGTNALNAVTRWLDGRDPRRPFFLFVNLMEAHSPYVEVPRRFRRAFTPEGLSAAEIRAASEEVWRAQMSGRVPPPSFPSPVHIDLRDGAVLAADHLLGELVDALDENTIVVVTSDHGDAMGEHDLVGHAVGLYEGLISIPMVVVGPGVPAGSVVTEPVSLADVAPTLLDLAGAESSGMDGVSFAPALRGEPLGERVVTAEQFRAGRLLKFWDEHRGAAELEELGARRVAVIGRRFKRVVSELGSDEGYDLERDPAEATPFPGPQTRLAADVPDRAESSGTDALTLSDGEEAALRALGYVE